MYPIPSVRTDQSVNARHDVYTIDLMRKYIHDYNDALEKSKTAAEFRSKITGEYPNYALERLIVSAADAALPADKK